jgi:hypothetical protein
VTSCAEFSNDHESEGGAVIMLFDMNRDNYSILFTPIEGDSINNAVAFTSNFAKQKFTNPSLIICSTV